MDYDFYNPYLLNKLDTIDAEELMATPYAPKNFIVAEMLPEGLTLLCGPSKIGKSWLVLQLCICVSMGVRFMGFNTQQCDVLYLALEDTFARVKDRVARMTEDCPSRLRFAVQAGTLGGALEEQLTLHKTQYPETKLVVIDTLQKVRSAPDPKSNSSVYGKDYQDIGALKKLADDLSIAIVLVHHLRKTKDKDDPFNEISGSTGLMGAADTALLLKKFDRASDHAELLWTGRDVQDGGVCLTFEDCIWETINGNANRDSSCYRRLSPIVYKTCEYRIFAKALLYRKHPPTILILATECFSPILCGLGLRWCEQRSCLPPSAAIRPRWKRSSFLTLRKRIWHLPTCKPRTYRPSISTR